MLKYLPCLLLLCVFANGAESPKFIYKKGSGFEAFDLQQVNLYFHKDSDNLRLIVNGKNIRMAYKSDDTEKMPFPKDFRTKTFQEKAEIVKTYRDFFRSEFALMLQAFVYTTPELFDWDVEKFKAMQNFFLISEKELNEIFFRGVPPKFYTVVKFKCKTGENVVFESDANGNFFMEVE
jgi:hypothetical protein